MNVDDFRADLRRERQRAAARGEQYAVELDLDVVWDVGAPLPFLVSDGGRAAVVFYQRVDDPDWDGSYVTVVDPSSEEAVALGVIWFDGVHEVSFGGLNDEAIEGHLLWGKGLAPYTAHEVVNSAWIAESERRNSVHPYHRGGWHDRMKHYVLCFHDETLECLASGLRTERFVGSYHDALRAVVDRLPTM